jgi:hypothetical protein
MRQRIPTLVAVVAIAGSASLASATDDMTSLSYISYLERYATLKPAQGGESLEAAVNMPVLVGDRLETARGARVEVELSDGSTVWVDEFTTLDFDAIVNSRDEQDGQTVLYLGDEGSVAVEVPETGNGEGPLRLDTPSGTLYLDRPGLYRVELRSGQLHVEAHDGLAELPSGIGSALVRGGQEAWLSPDGDLQRNVLASSNDDFWAWVQERRHPAAGGVTARYIDGPDASRAYTLDSYGDWVYVPTFSSYMWQPRVASGWVPYSCGRWMWTPVGWTWVSYEPWGWYPFHYGSWYWDASFGWVWSYDAVWGPAWVHWMYTPGYVGWCPRGYYDYWYWHAHHGSGHWTGIHRPDRWSDVAFDFSGRVRLGEVDRRPWTIVPADQFGNRRLERVRLSPDRLFGGRDANRYVDVRSGTLLTPRPDGDPARVVDTVLSRPGTRETADLGPIMGRDSGALGRGRDLPLRPTLTRDQVRAGTPSVGPGAVTRDEFDRRIIERRVGRSTPQGPASRDRVERPDGWVTGPTYRGPGRTAGPRDRDVVRPGEVAVPERVMTRTTVPSPAQRQPSTRVSPGTTRQTSPPTRVERPSPPRAPAHPGTSPRPPSNPRDSARFEAAPAFRGRGSGWEPRAVTASRPWAARSQPTARTDSFESGRYVGPARAEEMPRRAMPAPRAVARDTRTPGRRATRSSPRPRARAPHPR